MPVSHGWFASVSSGRVGGSTFAAKKAEARRERDVELLPARPTVVSMAPSMGSPVIVVTSPLTPYIPPLSTLPPPVVDLAEILFMTTFLVLLVSAAIGRPRP